MCSVIHIITFHWSGVNREEYLDLSLGYIRIPETVLGSSSTFVSVGSVKCVYIFGVNLVGFETRAGILAGFYGFWLFPHGFAHFQNLQNKAVKPHCSLHLEVSSSRIFVLKPAPRG